MCIYLAIPIHYAIMMNSFFFSNTNNKKYTPLYNIIIIIKTIQFHTSVFTIYLQEVDNIKYIRSFHTWLFCGNKFEFNRKNYIPTYKLVILVFAFIVILKIHYASIVDFDMTAITIHNNFVLFVFRWGNIFTELPY